MSEIAEQIILVQLILFCDIQNWTCNSVSDFRLHAVLVSKSLYATIQLKLKHIVFNAKLST